MKRFLYFLLIFIITSFCLDAHAQRDTEFWFAAPDNSPMNHGSDGFRDHPLLVRITSFDANAKVTLSQPANSNFEPIIVDIPPNGTETLTLANSQPELEGIECKFVGGGISPYGFRLSSTAPVTAYFENSSGANPDIYSLKGRNALGMEFVIPAQNTFDQMTTWNWNVVPNTFLIVATKDDTEVLITPSNDLKGEHPAGVEFSVILQKGEVFVAEATGLLASNHLYGSFVSSNKDIVIMVNDDSVNPPAGPDLMGDQTIPNEMLGQLYIVTKGFLSTDYVYVFGTVDGTKLYRNGDPTPIAGLDKGGLHRISLTDYSTYLESDYPVLVYHMTGWGQLGGAVIPPIECTGSNIIAFTRSEDSGADFGIIVFTQEGNEGNFTIDGNADLLKASDFQNVPGTGGGWKAANKMLNSITSNAPHIIENSTGLFHLGTITGAGNSCRYGFFSNFATLNLGPDQTYCKGDSVVLDAGPGQDSYAWFDYDFPLDTISTEQAIKVGDTGKYFCCATYEMCTPSDTIHLAWYPVPQPDLGNDTTVCPNIPVLFYPGDFAAYNWFDGSTDTAYESFLPQTIWVEVFDANGCHKIDSVEMFNYPTPPPIPIYHD